MEKVHKSTSRNTLYEGHTPRGSAPQTRCERIHVINTKDTHTYKETKANSQRREPTNRETGSGTTASHISRRIDKYRERWRGPCPNRWLCRSKRNKRNQKLKEKIVGNGGTCGIPRTICSIAIRRIRGLSPENPQTHPPLVAHFRSYPPHRTTELYVRIQDIRCARDTPGGSHSPPKNCEKHQPEEPSRDITRRIHPYPAPLTPRIRWSGNQSASSTSIKLLDYHQTR